MFIDCVKRFVAKFLIAIFGVMVVPFGTVNAQTDEIERMEKASLETKVHLLVYAEKTGLKLYSIPAAGDADQTINSRTIKRQFGMLEKPLGVFGGQLLTLAYRGQLLATDLETGGVRLLNIMGRPVLEASYRAGHLYAVVKTKTEEYKDIENDHVLVHLDLRTFKVTRLCELSGRRSAMQPQNANFSMTVSPNGKRVAVSEMKPFDPKRKDQLRGLGAPKVRVVFGSADKLDVVKTLFEFSSQIVFTGGGDYLGPPTFAWGNDETLVIPVSSEKEERAKLGMSHGGTPDGFAVPGELKTIDAESGEVKRFLELPKKGLVGIPLMGGGFQIENNQSRFPVVVTNTANGQERFVLDFVNQKLGNPGGIAKDYSLKPTDFKYAFEMTYQDEVRESHAMPGRIFPSTTSDRIAWFTLPSNQVIFEAHRKNDRGGRLHGGADLKIHDAVNGVRTLGTDFFGGSRDFMCLWATDSEMERSDKFDDLPQLKERRW